MRYGLVTGVDMQRKKESEQEELRRSFLEVTRQISICPPHFSGTLHMGCGTGHRKQALTLHGQEFNLRPRGLQNPALGTAESQAMRGAG